jgi:hypothetical protein
MLRSRIGTIAALCACTAGALVLLGGCAPVPAPQASQPVITAPSAPTGVSTASVTASPTPEATTSVVSTAVPAQPAENGKHLAFIHDVKKAGSDYIFVVDYADLFTGDAAYAEAKKDGVEADNDYYIRNVSKRLRTLRTNGNVTYIGYGDDPSQKYVYKVSDFYKWRTSSKKADDFSATSKEFQLYAQAQTTGEEDSFFFTVTKGLITRVEFFWTP